MYEAIVDPPDETDDKSGPRANFQKISQSRDKRSLQFFATIHCIEFEASLMDKPTVSELVKHRYLSVPHSMEQS